VRVLEAQAVFVLLNLKIKYICKVNLTLQAICSVFLATGLTMTEILIKVSSGKRPGIEKIPEVKPPECEDMIGIMQQCWHQDCSLRPAFCGKKPRFFLPSV